MQPAGDLKRKWRWCFKSSSSALQLAGVLSLEGKGLFVRWVNIAELKLLAEDYWQWLRCPGLSKIQLCKETQILSRSACQMLTALMNQEYPTTQERPALLPPTWRNAALVSARRFRRPIASSSTGGGKEKVSSQSRSSE